MELILAALIVSLGIVVSSILNARSKEKYHLKPKVSFAQVTVVGTTEQSEQMQISTNLLEEDSPEVRKAKINGILAIREERLAYQNTRMQALAEEQRKMIEEEKARMAAESESKKPALVK